jgi:glycosyltransferase involved in cell wall biosynthesis
VLTAHLCGQPSPGWNGKRVSGGIHELHVVFVVDTLTTGGTELNAIRTAKALVSKGIKLTLVHFQHQGGLLPRYAALGIHTIHVPVTSFARPAALLVARRLSLTLRSLKPDVVHAHDVYANIYCAAARVFFPRMPLVTSRRWAHSVPRPILMPVNSWAHRMSRTVVANSQELIPLLASEGVARSNVHLWPNSIAPDTTVLMTSRELSEWRSALNIPLEATVVVCVARFAPVKRHEDLIRAFAAARASHSDLHLLLVGDGPSDRRLRELVAEVRIEAATTFTGLLTPPPLPQQLGDIAILLSENEGFPNTLVEALVCERPVIATKTGGTEEVLNGGRNGFAVDIGDIKAAAEAIVALARNADLRHSIGIAGREFALARYSEDVSTSALLTAYRHTAARDS